MNEEKKLLNEKEADQLLASADGNAALLYLYLLRGGSAAPAEAARTLRRSEADMALALATLRRLGLWTPPRPPLPEETLPQLTTRDLKDIAAKDDAFQGVVAEAEKALGRVLSDNDLRILFGIYDHLALPADVIMLLLNHCIEEYQLRSGAGRKPPMRFVEKEAWYWSNQEICTIDAAEEHLRRCAERRQAAERIKTEVLGIRDRSLVESERKYVDGWLEMGFGPEALAIAYDRTVLRTGKLTWRYMDTILKSWSGKGLFTPEDIEAQDPAVRQQRKPAAQTAPDSKKQIEDLRKFYQNMTGGKGRKEG